MVKQHDPVGLAQSLGDPIVECQIFGRPLPTFAQLVAVVQVMQEMIRIVGLDRFGRLI